MEASSRANHSDTAGGRAARGGLRGSLLLALASTLLMVAAAEIFLRTFYPCPWYGFRGQRPLAGWFDYDAQLGWRGTPDADGLFAGRDYHTRASHNASGHRSRAPLHAPGRRNVLAIGDSFAWGWGVEDDEVFSERMMQLDPHLNVYNVSAPGWGTDQQYLALQEILAAGRAPPDLVLVIFCNNDFNDIQHSRTYGFPKPVFRLEGDDLVLHNVPVPKEHARGLSGTSHPRREDSHVLKRLHFYNLLSRGLGPLGDWIFTTPEQMQGAEQGVALATRLLVAMRDAAAAGGADFEVVLLRSGPRGLPWEELQAALVERGIAVENFHRRVIPSTHLWLDGHMNETGHRLLAEQLVEALAQDSRARQG